MIITGLMAGADKGVFISWFQSLTFLMKQKEQLELEPVGTMQAQEDGTGCTVFT